MIQQLAPGKKIITNGVDEQSTGAIYSVENLFTDIEELYQPVLLEVIRTGKIDDLKVKTMLCFFLFTQSLRNPSTWNYLKTSYANADPNEDKDMAILKMFIEFHRSLETHNQVMDAIMPFLSVKWVLNQTDRFLFPLSDNPLLMTAGKILIPLAPHLLLEILTDQSISADFTSTKAVPCLHHGYLSYAQYRQFRYATRLSAENEMIFGSEHFFSKNFFDYHFCSKS